jgi:hypothetical protein
MRSGRRGGLDMAAAEQSRAGGSVECEQEQSRRERRVEMAQTSKMHRPIRQPEAPAATTARRQW